MSRLDHSVIAETLDRLSAYDQIDVLWRTTIGDGPRAHRHVRFFMNGVSGHKIEPGPTAGGVWVRFPLSEVVKRLVGMYNEERLWFAPREYVYIPTLTFRAASPDFNQDRTCPHCGVWCPPATLPREPGGGDAQQRA